VDLIGKAVEKTSAKLLLQLQAVDPKITGIYYQYGHYNDVRERLIAQGKTAKDQRYPLVVLFEDFKLNNRVLGLTGIADVKIIILHTTSKDYTREQREARVFKPILVPIYEEFLYQLKVSGDFMQYGPFVHARIDRPHWGDPQLYKNDGYLLNDVLDGIELSDLQLQTYLPNCVTA
jgi:hypothetical protein